MRQREIEKERESSDMPPFACGDLPSWRHGDRIRAAEAAKEASEVDRHSGLGVASALQGTGALTIRPPVWGRG